ncbi:MAG: glutathione S-transferase [Proteobacteria bacterium]|nr:MAG: glutathione S-transferase [Pseudomonadota bacterium]
MLTLYHAPRSRSSRIVWLLEEIGAPYQIETVSIRRGDGSGARDPRNPHPDGKVPALVHDGRLVTESAAICLHLSDAFPAAKLGPPIGDPQRGDYLGWLFWYAGVVEPVVVSHWKGATKTDPAEATAYEQMCARLRGALERGPYLLGDAFSTADVLVASVFQWGRQLMPAGALFDDYVARLAARPAFQRAAAEDGEPG